MNNLVMPMLNERLRLTSALNTVEKYGFMINMLVGKKYPNGGWCWYGFNDLGFISSGSWGPCVACKSIEINGDNIKYTLSQGATDVVGGGDNFGGSPVQVKWWNPILSEKDLLDLGYRPEDAIVCWNVIWGFYDNWYDHHGTINIPNMINRCKTMFENYPDGYRGGFPSGSYSRGSGSNGTPSFFHMGIITAFRNKIFELATIYYIVANHKHVNNIDYSPAHKEVA